MITDPDAFLRFFQSIHRRTLRDIEALPEAAEGWDVPQIYGRTREQIDELQDRQTL